MKEPLGWIVVAVALVALSGCAQWFACTTTISYEAGKLNYQSCKNQENLVAKLGLDADGKLKALDVATTATTPEAAMAAAFAVNLKMLEFMERLEPLIKGAAMGGS